jgi:HEAT repeat protein
MKAKCFIAKRSLRPTRQSQIIAAILILMASSAIAQTPLDSINHVVDSLFIRAASISVYYADQVAPSKKALAAMADTSAPRLVEKMKTQDAREMQALEDIFKLMGHPAVPYLVNVLGSTDVYTRRLSARILAVIADSGAVDGLLHYTNDPDFRMRGGVISALGKIGNKRGVAPAKSALADNDYLVRLAAAVALANLKDSTTIKPLLKGLSDPYYGVRYSAADAISKIGKPAVKPVLDALAKPADTLAYYLLIQIAGDIADNRFEDPLSKIFNSDDPDARAFAAESLGKIGTSKAMDILHKRYDIETHPLVIAKIEAVVLK